MNKETVAAGGVIVDDRNDTRRVLLVHRPRYQDWSFPKGKLHPGESFGEAALREVKEETGLECRIIRPLALSRYRYRTGEGSFRRKIVHYFLMERAKGRVRVPGREVDRAEWFGSDEAGRRLTYEQDRKLLAMLFPTS